MDDRDIRAYLRGATAAKVISGWYFTGMGTRYSPISYIINTGTATCPRYTGKDAVSYCEMLAEAGVEPLYRA